MPQSRIAAVLCRIVFAAAVAWAAPIGLAGPDFERWYSVEMMGQRAGWMMSSQTTDQGTIQSRSKMRLAVGRGQSAIAIEFESEFIETLDHQPISMRSLKKMGTLPVESNYRFGEGVVTVETTQGGPEKTIAEEPLPTGPWLTPAGAAAFTESQIESGKDRIVLNTVDPLNGLVVMEVTREVIERTTLPMGERMVPVLKCRVTQNLVAIPSTEYVDSEGFPVRVETQLGAISLTMNMSSREEATAPTAPPEMMVSTFVKPDRRIPRPRYKKLASFTITLPEGDAVAEIPQAGAQRVVSLDDRRVRVTVDVLNPLEAAAEEARDPQFLQSSSLIAAADPAILALTEEAVKDVGPSPAARAEAIRRFVHDSITTKDLDVGFASATEVARTRRGDCTEHGVLLAAMLRAAGIPARVVSGLIYAEGFAGQKDIFGYHMWAQALLEVDGAPRWIDLDGTLGETAFDATHITLAVSALGDDQTYQALAPMATMIGRIAIKVDSAE